MPFTILNVSFRVATAALGLVSTVARAVLPPSIAHSISGAARALLGGPPPVDPTDAAVAFASEFVAKYGSGGPDWILSGWRDALSRAHSEGRFLFVYLHAPSHQSTDSFCRATLCADVVKERLQRDFSAWGGDITKPDAFALSASISAGSYPYVGVVAFSGARTRLISCAEGCLDAIAMADFLTKAYEDHSSLLWQERAEREQRELNRRLREEQDAEYEESLQADRERERLREEERRAQEEELRMAREADEKAAAEAQAAVRRAEEVETALSRRRAEKARTIGSRAEPLADEPGTTLLRVRLPSGNQLQRRFYARDPLQYLFDWVDTLEEHNSLKYSLASPYPRRVYGRAEVDMSLEALDLVPKAVLLLQPEDDREEKGEGLHED